MHRAGRQPQRVAGLEDRLLERLVGVAELDPRLTVEHVPRLVLDAVVLEAQRLAGPDEEHLSAVRIGAGPDQLVTPRLVDPLHHRYAATRVHTASHSGW